MVDIQSPTAEIRRGKKERKKKKPHGKHIMSASATQGGHNNKSTHSPFKHVPQHKINTEKLTPGLVISYDIRPGNGEALFLFQRFINLSLTYLLIHLPTYLRPQDQHRAKQPRSNASM